MLRVVLGLMAVLAVVGVASGAAIQTELVNVPENVQGDLCPFCVKTMDQVLNELVEIILNGGVLGSCSALCSRLGGLEATACNLLCDYVGIETFVKVLSYEDPDPIYVCQLLEVCSHTNGGKADMFFCDVTPKSGRQGTTFTVEAEWRVTAPTGPGGINIVVIPQGGFPISGGSFVDGQQPGTYGVKFDLKTKPSEQEPFNPGVYRVEVALCEGDCTTKHPWGGVYTQNATSFTITQ